MTATEDYFTDELFEKAPSGELVTSDDGTILRVNATFERWTGLRREDLVGARRFPDLLSAGGRIYYETHVAPLLHMQGKATEIAVEIKRADGTRLFALVNAVLHEPPGQAPVIRVAVFEASDRHRYEQELLRSSRREHDVALELQRGLLAGELPADPRAELGIAYRPGVSGFEVGGDWYDAFWIEEGAVLALVVGDVVGRGVQAAATMGQLRSAVRALASTGLAPGALLGALDRYAARHDVGRMTTLVLAALDLASGELRFACGGHPPPILLGAHRAAKPVWTGRSLPLDVRHRPGGPRPEGVCRLVPGDTVVLYTDGVVERSGRPIHEGIARLAGEVTTQRASRAPDLASSITQAVHDAEHRDDVCVLVARYHGPAA